MSRTVKHFSLLRIGATELRVISEVEDGVLPMIQIEEQIIQSYSQQMHWPHAWVMFFVLDDFGPLLRQLRVSASKANLGAAGYDLSPRSLEALGSRPMVNIYDMANLSGCNIYVNHQAMLRAGYWHDAAAITGLLAHEHAHPLAENDTTRASRALRLKVEPCLAPCPPLEMRFTQITGLLAGLVEKLCIFAGREIFTNQVTIEGGFASELARLNLRNLSALVDNLAGRQQLVQQLQAEVDRGDLTPDEVELLLLIGDLEIHLPLALEIAPFHRAGRSAEAHELEARLEKSVFPHLHPLVGPLYAVVEAACRRLPADGTPAELAGWGRNTLDILVGALAEKGLNLQARLLVEPGAGQ